MALLLGNRISQLHYYLMYYCCDAVSCSPKCLMGHMTVVSYDCHLGRYLEK
jgi:hypothetical protein